MSVPPKHATSLESQEGVYERDNKKLHSMEHSGHTQAHRQHDYEKHYHGHDNEVADTQRVDGGPEKNPRTTSTHQHK